MEACPKPCEFQQAIDTLVECFQAQACDGKLRNGQIKDMVNCDEVKAKMEECKQKVKTPGCTMNEMEKFCCFVAGAIQCSYEASLECKMKQAISTLAKCFKEQAEGGQLKDPEDPAEAAYCQKVKAKIEERKKKMEAGTCEMDDIEKFGFVVGGAIKCCIEGKPMCKK